MIRFLRATGLLLLAGLAFNASAAAPACPTISLAPTALAAGTASLGYSQTLTPTGAAAPVSFAVSGGVLPAGLSLAGDTIIGTPTEIGSALFTVSATDANGCTGGRVYQLAINGQAPVITSADHVNFGVGSATTFTVSATGVPVPTLTASGALPSGVTFTDNGDGTATLAGTPAAGTGGPHALIIGATNGIAPEASQDFTLIVNAAPAITSAATATFAVGAAGTFTVRSTGTPTPALSASGALPSGVTFLDNGDGTATLAGTPTIGGSYPLTLTADNGINPDATQSFTLSVQQAPTITSAASVTFTVGTAGTFTVSATGTPHPVLSVSGTLPGGVTLVDHGDGTATLAGTPAAGSGGSHALTITANNGINPNATQSFTLIVNVAPAITSAATATFTVGTPGTFTVTATGTPRPTLSVSGALPGGVTLADNGDGTATLAGMPAAGSGGAHALTITASNGVNPAATQSFTLSVNQSPKITSATSTTFTEGVAGTFTVTATGHPVPTFSSTGALPVGVSLSAAGSLSGTPSTGSAGSYPLTLIASNGVNPADNQSFSLIVGGPPKVLSVLPANGATGVALNVEPALQFSESVNATAGAIKLECPSGSPVAFSRTPASPASAFTLHPSAALPSGVSCALTVVASQVTSVASSVAMSANFVSTFTAAAKPVATDDTYPQTVIGNVSINSAGIPYSVFSNDSSATAATISAFDATTAQGGTVTMTTSGASIGQFTYNPPAGYVGTDTFTYTITNPGGSATATVSVPVAGMIWFIDNAASAGDGRLSSPFNSIAAFQALNDGVGRHPAANHNLFVRDSATAYSGALALLSGQRLIGQDASASLASITGLTPGSGSTALPATGGPLNGAVMASAVTAITLGANNLVRGLTVGGAAGAISGSGFGTLTVADTLITSTGPAVVLSNGTVAATFIATSSAGGSNNVSLTNIAGTLDLGGDGVAGGLKGASGAAFVVAGGTANITYAGSITNSTAQVVNVANKTAGSVNLNGTLTGTAQGVNLSNNPGAAINFGGAMNLSTGATEAFSATGAGTVTAASTASSLTTTTATALRVANVTIGAAGLTFKSISAGTTAGSPGNGIVLDSTGTSGGLSVVGAGAAGTGGVIQHKTGADGATNGIGVYLKNTKNASLAWMQLNDFDNFAIRGIAVDGFALSNTVINGANGNSAAEREGSVSFGASSGEPGGPSNGLTGAATVTNSNISGGFQENFRIANVSGSLNRLTMSGATIGPNNASNGNHGMLIKAENAAVMNVTINTSTFSGARASLFAFILNGNNVADLVFQNNALSNPASYAAIGGSNNLSVSSGNNVGAGATMTYEISGNSFRDANGYAVSLIKPVDAGSLTGVFANNTVGVQAVSNSGSLNASDVLVQNGGNGAVTTTISGNKVYQYNNHGIELLTGGGATAMAGSLNAKVYGNTVAAPGAASGLPLNGIHLNAGTVPGDTFQICADIGGAGALANAITGSGAGTGLFDFRLRQRQSTTVRLPSYGGGNTDAAAVVNFLKARNNTTPTGVASTSAPPGGGFVGGAACF